MGGGINVFRLWLLGAPCSACLSPIPPKSPNSSGFFPLSSSPCPSFLLQGGLGQRKRRVNHLSLSHPSPCFLGALQASLGSWVKPIWANLPWGLPSPESYSRPQLHFQAPVCFSNHISVSLPGLLGVW